MGRRCPGCRLSAEGSTAWMMPRAGRQKTLGQVKPSPPLWSTACLLQQSLEVGGGAVEERRQPAPPSSWGFRRESPCRGLAAHRR